MLISVIITKQIEGFLIAIQTKKYLEQENKWLWYYCQQVCPETIYTEFKQYNKKGELIAMSVSGLPRKKHRPKHPGEK